MGATGIEPMTSTVSIPSRLSLVLIRRCSSCTVVPRLAWCSGVNVPKLPKSLAWPALVTRRKAERFAAIRKDIRRAVLRRFPYSIFSSNRFRKYRRDRLFPRQTQSKSLARPKIAPVNRDLQQERRGGATP